MSRLDPRRMDACRIALANIRIASTPDESVALAAAAIAEAARQQAQVICFPECYVPGYRWPGAPAPRPDAAFLDRAWSAVGDAARKARVTVILGTERVTSRGLVIGALVFDAGGNLAGWQEKVQIDPSEEATYVAGSGRRVFEADGLTFGVAICHEAWRYPETVRWSARRGARVVFHPHAHVAEPGGYRPTTFADPANTFHEKAMLCRAAENTCYFASVNAASEWSGSTSAVIRPDGTVQCYQPYGRDGLLVADLDLTLATRELAARCRS